MSDRNAQALAYIASTVEARGYPPSVRELAEHLGYRSAESGHATLRRLVNEGLITVRPSVSRGITITATGMKALTEEL